ncbi:methyltransferase family protein [Crenalkalicoccus roseus]|uniref:methyltransferase family protein n=1 Tax=Crenalkalicoccus roseus TaxID=1485588 RepID=UPI00130539B5|nr:isoprenylcysteine carboxylmethyltransferase family protein [Crenalkalicoccus roseus]
MPPPLLVGGLVLAAWGLRRLLPLPVAEPLPALGLAVILVALGLILWALAVMLRAGTDPRPDRPDAALVEEGPFRFSRNPIYLGFLLAAAGFALRWGDLWGWVAVFASLLLLDRLVIAREEAYLAARFGPAYEAYRRRVRRWM